MGITQTGLALLLIAFIYLLTLAGSTFTEQVGCHRPYNMWHPDAEDLRREAIPRCQGSCGDESNRYRGFKISWVADYKSVLL